MYVHKHTIYAVYATVYAYICVYTYIHKYTVHIHIPTICSW